MAKHPPTPDAPAMFETGSDPFGRPVAWATIERTGEQLTMDAAPAPVHGSWCGTPCDRPGADEYHHGPMSSPIRGDRVEVLDVEGWHGPYTVVSSGRAYVTIDLDGRSAAYALTDTRRVPR